MLLAVVRNPKSGSALDDDDLERRLGAGGATVHLTAIDDLSAETLTARGAPDRVVVAGGDGSVGPAAREAAGLGVPLAVVPAGTANDFARAKGIPLDLAAACSLAADPDAPVRHAELGLVAGRPFVNAAAGGLSVLAARQADAHKARFGPLAYVLGALRAAATATPGHCRLLVDGAEAHDGDVWQVVVAVTGAFGGGSSIGGTRDDDRCLDAAIVPAGSRLGLARRAYGMRRARLTTQDDVPHLQGREVTVEGLTEFNVDGEICACRPARFTLEPGGFEVVAGSAAS